MKYGFGNGTIAAAFVRYNRELIARSERLSDRAFFPNEYTGEYSNQQFYYGYGNLPASQYNQQLQQNMEGNFGN